jgi:hypothetical protein
MTNTPANVHPLAKYIKEQLYDSLGLKLGSITDIDKSPKFIIWTKMKAKDIDFTGAVERLQMQVKTM